MIARTVGQVSEMSGEELLSAMIAEQPKRLQRQAVHLGVPASDADDAAQTVLVNAVRGLPALRHVDEPTMCSWLATIARRVAIDMARQARPESSLEDLPESALTGDALVTDGADRPVYARLELERVQRILTAVPRPYVEAFALHLDGFNSIEIGEQLGISAAAVRQRIRRVRVSLQP